MDKKKYECQPAYKAGYENGYGEDVFNINDATGGGGITHQFLFTEGFLDGRADYASEQIELKEEADSPFNDIKARIRDLFPEDQADVLVDMIGLFDRLGDRVMEWRKDR